MINIMLYGNGQHSHLEDMLSEIKPDAVNIIKTKDVYCKDKFNLDAETLKKVDIFIYQYIHDDTFHEFSSNSIVKQLKNEAIKLCIPNFWFSGLHIQNCKNHIYRPNKTYSISPSGIFPYGDNFIIQQLLKNVSVIELKEKLYSKDFLSFSNIFLNLQKNIQNHENRNKEQGIDININDFIINNLSDKNICYSVNHPTKLYFQWLIDEIENTLKLGFKSSNICKHDPFSRGHIHVPIYPTVIEALHLNYLSVDPYKKQYVFYNQLYSLDDYVNYYIKHVTLDDVNGKDVIDSHRYVDYVRTNLSNNHIKCNISNKNFELLKLIYKNIDKFKLSDKHNQIFYKNKLHFISKGGVFNNIDGLKVRFKGENNYIYIDENSIFNNSEISLGSNAFINIGSSKFNKLYINNTVHYGGTAYIGDNVIAGGGLRIDLLGNNKCIINDECIFGDNVRFMCSDGHSLLSEQKFLLNPNNNIIVGKHVWFSYNSLILKGAKINSNSMISACAVVLSGEYEANSLIAGTPARKIQTLYNDWITPNPDKLPK